MSAVGSPKKAVVEPVIAAPTNVNNNAKSAKGRARRAPTKKAAGKPKTHDMVAAAITAMKDKKGSSLQAIKKHVCANNRVDTTRINALIRLALKRGVVAGTFKQASGTGASGRFRMGVMPKAPRKKVKKVKKPKKPKKPKRAKKAKKTKKVKKPKAKKVKKVKPAKKPARKPKAAKKPARKPKAAKKTTKKPKTAKKTKRAPKAGKSKK